MTKLSAVKQLESKEQQTEVIDITPDMALKWLETNTHNRNVSDGLVDAYADDMKAKAWRLTHQGIAFDINGVLVDGQHRLWAIVRSKMTRAFFAYCHGHELEVIKPAMLVLDSPVYQKTLAYFRRGHA